MSLNDTPRAERLHIAIFGRRNAGKSSLINALTGQNTALVSENPGTTTDPVYKAMELHPIGPVVFIDTAGFDDEGELGKLRVKRTKEVIKKADVAIMVIEDAYMWEEKIWTGYLKDAGIPVIFTLGKVDDRSNEERRFVEKVVKEQFETDLIQISCLKKEGLDELKAAIKNAVPEEFTRGKILGELAEPGDVVMLVMPQDIQAPKGRLILPQVQTLRELLDNKCTTVCTTADEFEKAMAALRKFPDLIITDSQCFKQIHERKPEGVPLTSFSVLFAAYKGDVKEFVKGAMAVDLLSEDSRVLIAEACTHAPLAEDIGREKIPALLRKEVGDELQIDHVSGADFPKDLTPYDLVIHCGACMFNRHHLLSRIAQAKEADVPITNYGVTMAKFAGILDMIKIPNW